MSLGILVRVALAFGLVTVLSTARADQLPDGSSRDIDHRQWNAPQQPFRIYGNTWYVGPHGLSAILVDTGQGLALFDGGLPASASVIEANVRTLGFQVSEIKWILNSHAHPDHAGGIAALQRDSGAQVLASVAGVRRWRGAVPIAPIRSTA
ncbi:MBL fold metallo-hydrolase [Frateuria hangzhouensis]|uniref:MBL fold metallo-hydrolase n=1 Tax=Frateuria hangzhouensis TaxID=2995589 RepID=UPI002260E9D0|nr:MBL fold metallo-hydrolase [Frateuria sp. STR12]MCX7515150.1 MBL fold metallo-hydrolase [Frateuria sp. STR12]